MNLDTSGLDEYGGRIRFFESNHRSCRPSATYQLHLENSENGQLTNVDDYLTLVGVDQLPQPGTSFVQSGRFRMLTDSSCTG
jgi:hypothetical protein